MFEGMNNNLALFWENKSKYIEGEIICMQNTALKREVGVIWLCTKGGSLLHKNILKTAEADFDQKYMKKRESDQMQIKHHVFCGKLVVFGFWLTVDPSFDETD